MFQFPGFALKTLCIQVKSTWFCSLLRTQALNNKQSSGFPHSEIHGSKLILSSPWLIAEYHVLHRLLLPRHPPNALFALDLIQKKSDQAKPHLAIITLVHMIISFSDQKSYLLSRLNVLHSNMNNSRCSVSVLDLEQHCRFISGYIRATEEKVVSKCLPAEAGTNMRSLAYLQGSTMSILYLSLRCQIWFS